MERQLISALVLAVSAACTAPAAAAPPSVEMTWMSIANWYFKIGDKRIVMDGYITRVPENLFTPSPVFPKDMYTYTKAPHGIDLPAITTVLRVVRWNHSGDATNPIQHFARELYRPPVPDAASGGFRAGVGEDYPNGGGNRAFLFTIDRPGEQLTFFINNSASGFDLDKDVVVDGMSFGSPLGNLAAAMKDAGLTQVDAWIGTGGLPVAQQVVPVIKPKTYLPSHWDGLFNPFWPGLPYPFKDDALRTYLEARKITLVPETQYFDKFVLSKSGVAPDVNHAVKAQLGFADAQRFSRTVLDAVDQVASTSIGDDCGEGFLEPSAWSKAFALLDRKSAVKLRAPE